jgi:hypothetical protein
MAYDHKAVGTLIHVDGLLEDPAWANGSSETLRKIYDTIERLTTESPQAPGDTPSTPRQESPPSSPVDRADQAEDVDGPIWIVSAWPSPGGPWFVVHHRPTAYTVRTQSLDRLRGKIVRRFRSHGDV